MSEHLHELKTLLGRVRRRWFQHLLLCTFARAAVAASLPILLAVIAYWILAPQGVPLVILGVATAVLALTAATVVVLRMRPRPSDRQVARFIEERAVQPAGAPALDDAIVSAVDLAQQREIPVFASLVMANAVAKLRAIEPRTIISSEEMRRSALQAAGGAAVLAVALAVAWKPMNASVQTAWVELFPHTITVAVVPGDARVVAGQPLIVRASVQAPQAVAQRTLPSLTVSANGETRTVEMTRAGDAYEFAFESVDRSFTYQVAAATATSPEYSVTALFPPAVKRIDVRYEYPSFTGLKPHEEQDGGDIYGPAGTRVRVRIHTDKPIASGQLALAGVAPIALAPSGERQADATFVLKKDDAYRVALADADGLSSTGETEYFIRLMDDRPPEVRILRPSGDQGITPLEEIAIEARADDDYGVASFELVYSVAGKGERAVPFASVNGTAVAKTGSHLLAAEDLKVQPGDVITYYARARDIGRGKRPTETRSDMFFLEVKPFSEEFVAAQSQAGGSGEATPLDGLVAAQKEIITATWNIERRSQAGRSAEDIKAIAAAQAELKARAERMSSRGNRGIRPPLLPQQLTPPQQSRRGGSDPVAQAVDAMTRAIEQLHAERTQDALTHEMAALQGLLQAQAEIRRRQIMQQSASASGSGGSNRSSQDLSALFDKELQKQQKTNYENRSQIDQRPERKDDGSALDRIRDLARRQEDLERRERELAQSGASAEEIKRQLERLAREQEQLQRELEELSKQQQQNAQSGGSGQSGSQASTQQAMREASRQMREAAENMKRQNADGASQSAARAAEQLREAEQQLRGGTTNARQRAAGEMQLEAQQIAEAQRRIANEMSRLEKEGQAGGDAMRRLAAEKDKLADRVDDLQRAAQQVAKDGDKGAADGARQAAQQLQQGKIGERMRDGAKEMRGGGAPADRKQHLQREQQLADAMDRVVDAMTGNAGAEARKMADALSQTREMRERLNRLEQQMRDAQQGGKAGAQPSGRAGEQGKAEERGKPGEQGKDGQQGSGGGGDLQKLREEYARELQRTREALGRMQGEQRSGLEGATPEQHEYSRSAPGNEAFKQDFSNWEGLRKDIDLALERYEANVSDRLAKKLAEDRLSAGGSAQVPEEYRRRVAKYYEALAKVKK